MVHPKELSESNRTPVYALGYRADIKEQVVGHDSMDLPPIVECWPSPGALSTLKTSLWERTIRRMKACTRTDSLKKQQPCRRCTLRHRRRFRKTPSACTHRPRAARTRPTWPGSQRKLRQASPVWAAESPHRRCSTSPSAFCVPARLFHREAARRASAHSDSPGSLPPARPTATAASPRGRPQSRQVCPGSRTRPRKCSERAAFGNPT
mmetsp:Transcript_36133/g.115851  ORF Transcript_36133/g.115851 Transcript_36133/m.115851 type:complete len:208 (-) Transcript_36133:353-976(-)